MQRGRVRVLLKREDGSLCNPEISSSKFISIMPFLTLILAFVLMLCRIYCIFVEIGIYCIYQPSLC